MNNTNERFITLYGFISMNNERLKLEENSLKKDVKQRGGWLSVFFVFVGISTFSNLRKEDYFQSIFRYIDFGLRVIGMIAIVAILYYILFMKKSQKNLVINEIKRIDIEEKDLETEVTLIFNNNREKDLEFRTHENQVEPFIEALKKRNSRIEIKLIK